jgi:hypothetical protein
MGGWTNRGRREPLRSAHIRVSHETSRMDRKLLDRAYINENVVSVRIQDDLVIGS